MMQKQSLIDITKLKTELNLIDQVFHGEANFEDTPEKIQEDVFKSRVYSQFVDSMKKVQSPEVLETITKIKCLIKYFDRINITEESCSKINALMVFERGAIAERDSRTEGLILEAEISEVYGKGYYNFKSIKHSPCCDRMINAIGNKIVRICGFGDITLKKTMPAATISAFDGLGGFTTTTIQFCPFCSKPVIRKILNPEMDTFQ